MIKVLKFLAFAMVVLMLCAVLLGCTNDPALETFADETEQQLDEADAKLLTDELKLAWSPKNLDDEYYVKVTQGFEDYCEQMGYTALVANPNNNRQEQFSEFENWVAMGVDAIAASPVDAQHLETMTAKAQDAEIIVAGFFEEIPNADVNLIMDDYEFGVLIGENALRWIDEKLDGKAKVLLFCTDENKQAILTGDGIDDTLGEYSGVQIISRQSVESEEEAQTATELAFGQYAGINVIVCDSDESALGALNAVNSLRIEDKMFYIGGAGYTQTAIEKMNEAGSYFRSTVDMQPYQAGKELARIMADYVVNGAKGDALYLTTTSYWQNLLAWQEN